MDTAAIDRLTMPTGKRRRVKIDGNLYMNVTANGGRSWLLFVSSLGVRQEFGLGPYPLVPFQRAKAVAGAPDPERAAMALRDRPVVIPTFGEYTREVVRQLEKEWKSEAALKHAKDWLNGLARHAAPLIHLPVSAIEKRHVAQVIAAAPTDVIAKQTRQRIRIVLHHAMVADLREQGPNPADAETQKVLSGKRAPDHKNHGACPYDQVGALLAALPTTIGAEVARFATLTGARMNEAIGARWSEIDRVEAVWTIPANRMKAKQAHSVPLSDAALAILDRLPRSSDWVFPGRRDNRPVSRMAVGDAIRSTAAARGIVDKDTGAIPTMHGMRAALIDWGIDKGYSETDMLRCIAHASKSKSDRAYLRKGGGKRRRKIMRKWAAYLTGQEPDAKAA